MVYTLTKKREDPGSKEWTPNPNGRNKRAVWQVASQPFPEAHFATYPEKLIETPIKAGCPEYVCRKCGTPREKILEKEFIPQEDVSLVKNKRGGVNGKPMDASNRWQGFPRGKNKIKFKGYTDCKCYAGFEPGIVLDPFMGNGTTALVALKNHKRFVGIELNPEYIKIANKRIKPELEQMRLI